MEKGPDAVDAGDGVSAESLFDIGGEPGSALFALDLGGDGFFVLHVIEDDSVWAIAEFVHPADLGAPAFGGDFDSGGGFEGFGPPGFVVGAVGFEEAEGSDDAFVAGEFSPEGGELVLGMGGGFRDVDGEAGLT